MQGVSAIDRITGMTAIGGVVPLLALLWYAYTDNSASDNSALYCLRLSTSVNDVPPPPSAYSSDASDSTAIAPLALRPYANKSRSITETPVNTPFLAKRPLTSILPCHLQNRHLSSSDCTATILRHVPPSILPCQASLPLVTLTGSQYSNW
ncbi:hypothetical protein F5887DRAFT_1081659 [Amanita rubescens]|nr:hypothetical protein F5887DRAFT_1081659 [Amanita rubescens]